MLGVKIVLNEIVESTDEGRSLLDVSEVKNSDSIGQCELL